MLTKISKHKKLKIEADFSFAALALPKLGAKAAATLGRAPLVVATMAAAIHRKAPPLLLAYLLLMLFPLGLLGASSGSRRSGRSSVFSLFNLKQKSKFWSESVIRGDFDDLESSVSSSSGKMGLLNFTKAGNLASYLKLSEVESLYLPVPVNFIFIGFEGKGNYEFKLGFEELERWFSKIDHVFQHTRVPNVGEILSPFYKASIDKSPSHHLPLVSPINYNLSVHAIQMGEKVTSVFEHAIKVLSRKDNISDTGNGEAVLWQVDVDRMEYLFWSLVQYLELENAYNIFILNLKHDKDRANYGYRRGLSESEITFLKENEDLHTKLLESEAVKEISFEIDHVKRPLYSKHPLSQFAWTAMEDIDTADWSNICLDALNNIGKLNQGRNTTDVVFNKVKQLLHSKNRNDDLKSLLHKGLKSEDLAGLHPECLSDTWIGNERWAFVDLSAGPFSWGPAVGGEGVRTERSLPSVKETIGAISEISEEEAEDWLQDAIQEKFSVFSDQDHQSIDILLAEIDIYELFAFKHCQGRKSKLALCEELDERMKDLRNELQSMDNEESDENHRRKAVEALKRMENWNLFSDTREELHNYTVARDSFLAHLGSVLWGSMRHVISPSISEGAYHYYEKILYQLYFITQEKIRNTKDLSVELKTLTEGLSSLSLPTQKVMFSQHMLTLSEDPSLAMAFAVARRAAAVPLLLVNGTYRSTVRTYLDSSILQQQLQRLSDHGSLKGSHSHSRSTLEVPIFWFVHGDPLLVDKHYQAKALSDMVIVVQSDTSSWESHLQCNGRSLLWNLRRPAKAAVAATAEHLAGLLPLQLVYSHAHETAVEDWLWSVGCNPFSITSHGRQVSRFQLDTIARSYIITALEDSVRVVNEAVHLLVMERTTEQTYQVFKSMERDLVDKYNSVVSMWRRISTISSDLRYVDAMSLLSYLEDASKGFMTHTNSTLAKLHPIHCTKERKVQMEFDITTIPAFLLVFAVLWFVLRPRRPKPKIN